MEHHNKNQGFTQKDTFPLMTKVGFMVLALCACMVALEENIAD